MAKDNMLLGMARGKVGDLVFYRSGGVQITRARNRHPNNPQTFAQMSQRLMLANASKAAKGFEKIVNHSFENVKYGVESVRHFQSLAQKVLKVAHPTLAGTLQVTPCVLMESMGFPVAEFILSEGTLDAPSYTVQRRTTDGTIIAAFGGAFVGDIQDVTVRDFCDAFGVDPDMQLTIVRTTAIPAANVVSAGVGFNSNRIEPFIRLNFESAMYDEAMFDASGEIIPDVLNLEKSNNWGDLSAEIATGNIILNTGENCSGFCIIASRYEDGRWRRSTSVMSIAATEGTAAPADNLASWGWNDYQAIINAFRKQKTVGEDYYLNKENNDGPAASGDVTGVVTLDTPIVLTPNAGAEDIEPQGIPAEPTTVVFRFQQAVTGEIVESENLVGMEADSEAAEFGDGSFVMLQSAWLYNAEGHMGYTELKTTDDASYSVVILGGYMVCNGVRFIF